MFDNFPKVPRSIMNANVKEDESPIEMEVTVDSKNKEILNDLHGHVFIIAPADDMSPESSKDSTKDSSKEKGLPFKDKKSTFLNGNGMIYRLDFNEQGTVKLKRKLVKSPDYKVDQAIQNNQANKDNESLKSADNLSDQATQDNKYNNWLKFNNYGIVRFSWLLGVRNQLNTACLPMKFREEEQERLLVTYDAGRPYEIDTDTLETVTPIGKLTEWEPGITKPLHPFPLILSSAHPAFDQEKNQMFTVNYGRSLSNLLQRRKGEINNTEEKELLEFCADFILGRISDSSFESDNKFIKGILKFLPDKIGLNIELLSKIVSNLGDNDDKDDRDFVYLMRWDGTDALKKWQLVHPDDKKPVHLNQSVHQIAVTEDYVVLMDTAFATGMEQVINDIPDVPFIKERKLIANRPSPDSILYIVRRDDLEESQETVVAYRVTIPREASHFLADYENPDGKITLHIAHIGAWDIAEWIREKDKFPDEDDSVRSDLKSLVGTQVGQMDISHMGRHIIDAKTLTNKDAETLENKKVNKQPIESTIMSHSTCTWGPGLPTYSPSLGITPKKLDNIYWVSFGLWKELTTEFMYDQYKDYKYRQIPLDELVELAKKGIPSCLYRLDTQSMTIPDYYQSEPGHLLLSPQFVPRRNSSTEDSTNGYIVCVAFTPDGDEIWIFDAKNLKDGPQCKLDHPTFNIGLSLHTAWLEKISPRQAEYKIPVTEDYQEVVQNWLKFIEDLQELTPEQKREIKREIKDLFQKHIDSSFKFD